MSLIILYYIILALKNKPCYKKISFFNKKLYVNDVGDF